MSSKKIVPSFDKPLNRLEITNIGLVTAIYITVSLVLAVISFGVIQFRIAEMLNYLSLYQKKYIWSITLGVMVTNIFSPLGLIDVVVGGLSTFLVLSFNLWLTKKIKSMKLKMMVTALVFSLSMFTVAGQLTVMFAAPFWLNWLIIGLGELLSMGIGGIIMYNISKKIDLTK